MGQQIRVRSRSRLLLGRPVPGCTARRTDKVAISHRERAAWGIARHEDERQSVGDNMRFAATAATARLLRQRSLFMKRINPQRRAGRHNYGMPSDVS